MQSILKTQISSAERNRPASGNFSDTEMKALVLQNLSEFTSGDEAISPDVLVSRLVEAIKEKRFYAITTDQNPWYLVMNERFKAIQEAGNPPFLVPTRDGVQGLK